MFLTHTAPYLIIYKREETEGTQRLNAALKELATLPLSCYRTPRSVQPAAARRLVSTSDVGIVGKLGSACQFHATRHHTSGRNQIRHR